MPTLTNRDITEQAHENLCEEVRNAFSLLVGSTMQKMESGNVKVYRIGAAVRIDIANLEAALDDHRGLILERAAGGAAEEETTGR